MFGLSISEVIIILLVGFILIGPEKLPTFARGLARGIKEVKNFASNLSSSIKEEINDVVDEEMVQDLKDVKNLKKDVKAKVKAEVDEIIPEELQNMATNINSIKNNNPKQLIKDRAIDAMGMKDEVTELKEVKDSINKKADF